MHEAKFADLIGKTIIEFRGGSGDDEITIKTSDGAVYRMWHAQDCCESVYIESLVGDVGDVIGSPVLVAEESTSENTPADFKHEYEPDSQTWTFYKLDTRKGGITIRWFGESNGYYSESVDFDQIEAPEQSQGD